MLAWLRYFIELCFLKAKPQDAPSSRSMVYFSVLLYWSVGVVFMRFSQSLPEAVLLASVQTGLLFFLTNLSLWVRKAPERFSQTITALTGTGAFIALIGLPILQWIADPSLHLDLVLNILWLVLVIWESVVMGNILRFALDVPFIAGLGIAMVFMYMSFAITWRFLKVLAFSAAT